METLKQAEEQFQQKVERLNLQIQDRMQRLRSYETQKKRFSSSYSDAATQTDDDTTTSRAHSSAPARQDGDYMSMHGSPQHVDDNANLAVTSHSRPVSVDTATVNDSGFNTPDPDEVSPVYNFDGAGKDKRHGPGPSSDLNAPCQNLPRTA